MSTPRTRYARNGDRTVTDLVAGSGLRFDSRGLHALRGVPGEWELFQAADQPA